MNSASDIFSLLLTLAVILFLTSGREILDLFSAKKDDANKANKKEVVQKRSGQGRGLALLKDLKRTNQPTSNDWKARYHKYLASEEWQQIRTKVLLRSSGACEACGVKPAKEVHHRTYERVGCESLLDLVAVCEDCHHKIHFGIQSSAFSSLDVRMKSKAWESTRQLLFSRASNVCEGCGCNPIQDIYFLNGESTSLEILYELAALCFSCRDRIINQASSHNEKMDAFVREYSFQKYLDSPEWKMKAERLISRANNICEICAEKPISEVRHLSYSRAGSEMLFDLAGVCSSCESKLPRIKAPKFFYKEV